MTIKFTYTDSILIYCVSLLFMVFMLLIGSCVKSNRIRKLVTIVAFIPMFFLIAFREMGVDRESYVQIFKATKYYKSNYVLSGFMEPGYFLLNLIFYQLGKEYYWIQYFQAVIYIYMLCCFTMFCYRKNISPIMSMIIHFGTIFFYMMGLNRMSIAVSLFVIALIDFEKNRNRKRLYVLFLIIFLFHYSAILPIAVFWRLFVKRQQREYKRQFIIVGIIFPLLFGIGMLLFSNFLRSFIPMKYGGYLNGIGLNFSYWINIIYILPLIVVFFILFYNRRESMDKDIWFQYMTMITFLFNISILFNGAFRITFYINIFIGYLYSILMRKTMPKARDRVITYCVILAVVMFYCYNTFFDSIYFKDAILPIKLKL